MYPDPDICERCDKPKESGEKRYELCHDCQDEEAYILCNHRGVNLADEFLDNSAGFGLPEPYEIVCNKCFAEDQSDVSVGFESDGYTY